MATLLFKQSPLLVLTITIFFLMLFIISSKKICLVVYLIIILILIILYRNPKINYTYESNFIYSPSYGTVFDIQDRGNSIRISSFLSIADIHVQYTPCSGKVTNIEYFLNHITHFAFDKDYYNNEHVVTTLDNNIQVVQIAGKLFRRIVNFLEKDSQVETGQLLGMIKMGSRVDTIIPKEKIKKILIKKGDKLIGGCSKLVELN